MTECCGRPDCAGLVRCEEPGCEALHPNACGAVLPHWRCPGHEVPPPHEWVENGHVAGCFVLTDWCWRCGMTRTGPLGAGKYEYRVPGSQEVILRLVTDDAPACAPVRR